MRLADPRERLEHSLDGWFTRAQDRLERVAEPSSRNEVGYCRGRGVGEADFIPTIVLAEALAIFEKKRVLFNFKALFRKINGSENFMLISLDYPILEEMMTLKEIPEIHDKIIVSTAKYLKVPIITKDKILRKLSFMKTVW